MQPERGQLGRFCKAVFEEVHFYVSLLYCLEYFIFPSPLIKFSDLFSLFLVPYRNNLSYYTNYMVEFNENYVRSLHTQIIRSKIFLFFVDPFSIENEFFLYNFIYAHVSEIS